MREELRILARAYADGEITDSQLQRLEYILRGEPAARQRYLEEMSLINSLEEYSLSVDTPRAERIRETNHIWIIYKMAAALWLVIAAFFVFSNTSSQGPDFTRLQFLVMPAAIHFVLIGVLGRITVEVDHICIKVGMGPFKSKTRIEDVQSIRTCTIRPIRDLWGWGWRRRMDGTRGFIGDGNEGFEFTRSDGKRTVVTARDPQRFVDFVQRLKANETSVNGEKKE
ncbi:MAG: hypothetical protein AAF483_03755 [Planctomycetota bacterium]